MLRTTAKLAACTLALTGLLAGAFASPSYAESYRLEDDSFLDYNGPQFQKDFTLEGRRYTAAGQIDYAVSEEREVTARAILIAWGAPTDLAVSYAIKCGEYWERFGRIDHAPIDSFINVSFHPYCHIPGEEVSAVRADFYFGASD